MCLVLCGRQLAQEEAFRETLISVDTFHSSVARWAVDAGAHLVNDVSGGSLDPDMHAVVRFALRIRLSWSAECGHVSGTRKIELPET